MTESCGDFEVTQHSRSVILEIGAWAYGQRKVEREGDSETGNPPHLQRGFLYVTHGCSWWCTPGPLTRITPLHT